jgi:hypothetical protein
MIALRTFGGGLAALPALSAGAANAAQPPTAESPATALAVHEASLRFAVPTDWIAP